jgi:uncharacterized protein YuzE
MKVSYDSKADAAYIKLSKGKPYGAIEIDEGVVIHVTKNNRLISIEILDASKRFNVNELFTYEVEDGALFSSR